MSITFLDGTDVHAEKRGNQINQDSCGKGLSFGIVFIAKLSRGYSTGRHRHYRYIASGAEPGLSENSFRFLL